MDYAPCVAKKTFGATAVVIVIHISAEQAAPQRQIYRSSVIDYLTVLRNT